MLSLSKMHLTWVICTLLYALVRCENEPILLSKTHASRLEKYKGYVNAAVLHFKVPVDTNFASFRFQAEEVALTIFGCRLQNISIYLKQGSPPVINPDGSKFPDNFLKYGRPKVHCSEFISDNVQHYINITSPMSGSYFAAAFISYTDPKNQGITQEGLTPDCITFLNAALYVKQKPTPHVISADKDLHVLLLKNASRVYKFYVPEIVDSAILSLRNINFCENCTELLIRIQPYIIPNSNDSLYDIQLKKEEYTSKTFTLNFMTMENAWYYMTFVFNDSFKESTINTSGQFLFKITYYSSFVNMTINNKTQIGKIEVQTKPVRESELLQSYGNDTVYYKHSIIKSYQNKFLDYDIPMKQYSLVRDSYTESFMYSFDLHPNSDGFVPLFLNVTDQEINVLKGHLYPGLDIGGTLEFSLAFKPQITTTGSKIRIKTQPSNNQTIIACITNKGRAIPTWPNKCVLNEVESEASIIINRTVDNNTLYVPYPEPGDWYATFKLFCGTCKTCKCSDSCKKQYKSCSKLCENSCERSEICDSCIEGCEHKVLNKSECANCDCIGSCQRNKTVCSSSVMFSLSSYPCVSGKCGSNGRCMYLVSEGLAYSVCVCSNHFRVMEVVEFSNLEKSCRLKWNWNLRPLEYEWFTNTTYLPLLINTIGGYPDDFYYVYKISCLFSRRRF